MKVVLALTLLFALLVALVASGRPDEDAPPHRKIKDLEDKDDLADEEKVCMDCVKSLTHLEVLPSPAITNLVCPFLRRMSPGALDLII